MCVCVCVCLSLSRGGSCGLTSTRPHRNQTSSLITPSTKPGNSPRWLVIRVHGALSASRVSTKPSDGHPRPPRQHDARRTSENCPHRAKHSALTWTAARSLMSCGHTETVCVTPHAGGLSPPKRLLNHRRWSRHLSQLLGEATTVRTPTQFWVRSSALEQGY